MALGNLSDLLKGTTVASARMMGKEQDLFIVVGKNWNRSKEGSRRNRCLIAGHEFRQLLKSLQQELYCNGGYGIQNFRKLGSKLSQINKY